MHCSKFNIRSAVAAASVTVLLAGCGGGGGGGGGGGDAGDPGTPPPVAPPGTIPATLEALQGFWGGPFDSGTTAQAIILRTGEVWMVVQSGTTIQSVGRAQAVLNASGASASGGLTHLQSGVTAPLALTATAVAPKTTITGTVTTSQTTRNLTWSYGARYDTPLPVADFAGRWTSTADQQRFAVTWDFTAQGAISGTSTTGCSYAGTLAPLPQPVAVVAANLVETCAGASTALTGVATMNDAKNRASFVLATQAGNQYTFAALQK